MTGVANLFRIGRDQFPLIGNHNIWVDDSAPDLSSLEFCQFLVCEALTQTSPGELEVLVYDSALSGIASPFQEVNSSGEKVLKQINDAEELKETLRYLRNHVRDVLNIIQGRAPNLLSFREQYPQVTEGYKLVVLSSYFLALDEEIQGQVMQLLRAGPRAGVTFLIHSLTDEDQDVIEELVIDQCDHYQTTPGGRVTTGDNYTGYADIKTIDTLISSSQQVARDIANSTVQPLDFKEVQTLSDTWTESSRDALTFVIGRHGLSTMEVTLGDELNQRHNALITGAVGQGKSNLISVVVHSLCQRYSPSEVEFYMLDFKEGVTLQAFAPDPSTGSFLPHARVLGLDADREYGVNVLRHLFAIYRQRMATFKAAGVQNIRQYRLADPEAVMPRIVVVIDEFQMLFADQDTVATTASDLIIKGARLFRACGIHFILASQTIGSGGMLGGTTGQALFAQIPVRLALKNSLAESHATLGLKNDAASHIRSREAIVNLDYGELSSNRKTTIAYADDAILAELRTAWWQQAQGTVTPPEVFEGERRLRLGDDARVLTNLQSRHAMLGRRITVGVAPLAADFSTDVGRNLALFGTGPGHTILLNAALSLLHSTPAAEIIGLDLTSDWHSPEHDNVRIYFEQQLTKLGSIYRLVDKHQADALIDELVERAATTADNASAPPVYVIGFGLERWRSDTTKIKKLFANGPLAGIHLLGWWNKYSSFKAMVGFGGDNNFDIRIAMHLDHSSAREAFKQPILRWTPQDNRALVWDSATMSNPQLVIPYSRIN